MLVKLLNLLGFAVCHQLPERSLHFSNRVLSICARDTGIYLGLLVSVVFLTLLNRKRQSGLPPWYVLVFGAIGVALMAADGFTSYSGWRTTTNDIRLLTGLLTGAALPLVLVPIFNFQVWKENSSDRIMRNFYHFLGYLAVIALTFFIARSGLSWLFWPIALLSALAIIFAFIYINLILITLIPLWTQKAERLKSLIVPLVIAGVLTAIELALSYQFHAFLLSRLT